MKRPSVAGWLLFALAACGTWVRAATPQFRPPDGHWWLTAGQAQRDAFVQGYEECYVYTFGLPYVATPSHLAWQPAITAYYRRHASALSLPVPEVIHRVESSWLRGEHGHLAHDSPRHSLNGVAWVQIGEHDLIIRGFLSCQAAVRRPVPDVPVASIVARVNALLGISKAEPWYVGKHGDDRLGPVILKAERQAAAARRGHPVGG